MNKATGVLKMHWRDKWSWVYIPWIVCLSSFLVNVFIGLIMPEGAEFYTGGLTALYIYFFVAGIVTPVQTFPFALGLGVRRTDYFLGTAAMALLISAGNAGLLLLFTLMEQGTGNWGVGLHFFKFPFIHEGPLFFQWLTMLLFLLFVYFAGLLIAGIYRRFGKLGLFIFFGIWVLVVLVVPMAVKAWGSWAAIGRWLGDHFSTMYDLAPVILLCILVFAAASFALFRRATV